MKIDILKHTIVNVCKSITYGMKKPDKKFFRTSLESMMEYQTTVLSRMGDTRQQDAKHILKYHSYHLGKKLWKNLSDQVFHLLSRFIWDLSPDTCICFDSVDINKYSAKQMEDLRKVRDGSTGDIVNGYVLNAVSIRWIPLLMERELLKDRDGNELTTRYDIFEKQVKKIREKFEKPVQSRTGAETGTATDTSTGKGEGKGEGEETGTRAEAAAGTRWLGCWILADRLYDDVKKYNLLMTEWFRFAIRMKTTRYVMIEEVISLSSTNIETGAGVGKGTGTENSLVPVVPVPGLRIQVKDLPEGHYQITFPGLMRSCFLTVKLRKGMKHPIRVLSSEKDTDTVLQYLKRWEIERIFKSGKQELELESIGTKSKEKIDHLIALVQLSLGISAYVYNQLESQIVQEPISGKIIKTRDLVFEGNTGKQSTGKQSTGKQSNKKAVVDATAFVKEMKRYLIQVSKTFNRNSIICFIGDYMKKVRKIHWNMERVTLKPEISCQLSLGF